MDKNTIKQQISEYLLKQEDIVFAYLFGSFSDRETFRDIDVAVYTRGELELLRLGRLQSELSGLVGVETDILVLNNLFRTDPAFVYEVVTSGEVLFSCDDERHTTFKKDVFLRYFDTQSLRESVDKAFDKRLNSNRFGQRNYAP